MTALARSKAAGQVALVESLTAVVDHRNKASAMMQWAKTAKDPEKFQHAAEEKIRAERKAGEILIELAANGSRQTKGRPKKLHDETFLPKLSDIGVSNQQSRRWQLLAELPNEEFELRVEDARQWAASLSSAVFLRDAIARRRQEQTQSKRQQMAQLAASVDVDDRWAVHAADMRTWQADRQYDWIITDPPYPREFLPLYESLAERANDWLKDGGLVVAMCGQSYLADIYAAMSKHLTYYWTCAYLLPGQPTPLMQRQVNTSWKPLLVFAKGEYKGKTFGDTFKSEGNDKDHHMWGQSISGMVDVVSKLALPGESILDPFCGAGTTGIAAVRRGCYFTGLEIDEQNALISRARIAEGC